MPSNGASRRLHMSAVDAIRQDLKGRRAQSVEEPGVCGGGAAHPGARHRRDLRDLQRRQSRAADAACRTQPPEQRVLIWSKWISFDKTWLSTQEICDYRAFAKTMTAMAGWSIWAAEPDRRRRAGAGRRRVRHRQCIRGAWRAAVGRPHFSASPKIGRTARRSSVLGYPLWQARYGGDPRSSAAR